LQSEHQEAGAPWPRLTRLIVAISIIIIAAAVFVPPFSVLDKADMVGGAVCHRLVDRSFVVDGRPLPLCARCSGTFLGTVLGLAAIGLRRRQQANRLPPLAVLLALVAFVALWGFDGLNSYATLFPGVPHLYEPRNWLRLTTGMLNGLALISFLFPVWNFTLRRETRPEPVIQNVGELLILLVIAALLIILITMELELVLYAVAIVSSLGVMMMLTLIYSMVAAVALRREGYARSWRQLLVPLSIGLALSLLQIGALVLLRSYLTARLGLPF
jgi:uncharacterized membrane protein